MDTLEGNKLIAEFMGQSYIADSLKGSSNAPTFSELKFHTSWDWLMPVIEKIEDFYNIDGKELEFQCVTYEDEVKIIAKHPNKKWEVIVEVPADGSGKKENTYKAALEFIQWYNDQNK